MLSQAAWQTCLRLLVALAGPQIGLTVVWLAQIDGGPRARRGEVEDESVRHICPQESIVILDVM